MRKKTKVMRISRQPSQAQIMTDQKQLGNVENFNSWGSIVTNDASCTREIKIQDCRSKPALNKKTLSINKYDLNLRNKPVKCYIWSIALYGAETWTLRKEDQRYPGRFEMWCWRRMTMISWTDRVRNEVSHSVKDERNILQTIQRRKANRTGYILSKNCLLKHVIEGNIEGRV